MDFLKKLFGGGSQGTEGDPDGLYYYVRSDQTDEVIRVRLHRYNDLSQSDGDSGFFARKVAVGSKSFDRIEIAFTFDKKRQLADAQVTGGKLVGRDEYEAYLAERSEG
ncbi:hypothetical protein [Aggregatilinea lenta]|uniref:hypothetical protein n=1 Tax=Aggregatilinea lenta TaxID=913108 RepID=UPI000E5A5A10|nr:hypothetical protein [Aggregatilinea lenta]